MDKIADTKESMKKCRAWIPAANRMAKVWAVLFDQQMVTVHIDPKEWRYEPYDKQIILEKFCTEDVSFSQCTVMRSLGMTDKNGREIYEGDVLGWPKKKDRFEIEEDPCYPGTLAMMGKYGDFYGPLSASRAKKTVVLGNRFEDPDLLKDGICGR